MNIPLAEDVPSEWPLRRDMQSYITNIVRELNRAYFSDKVVRSVLATEYNNFTADVIIFIKALIARIKLTVKPI